MQIQNFDKTLFNNLLLNLSNKNITYAIIGDYQQLPESVAHDIDIWTENVWLFREVLLDVIHKTGYHIIIDNCTANGCNVVFYKRDVETLIFMKIDVLTDTSYKSVLTLVEKKTIANCVVPYKDFYVLTPEVEALGHFLYPMFEWGCIKKEQYKKDIKKYFHSEVFYDAFCNLWGRGTATKLLRLIDENRWDDICRQMGHLKKKAVLKGLFRLNTWSNIIYTFYFALCRFVKPSGKCLVICGLDGAGKTTILDELNKLFVDLLKSKKVFYGYWRPFVIPEIRELFGKKNSKADKDIQAQKGLTVVEPEKEPKNKFVSLLKLFYYLIDYMLAPFKYGSIRNRGGVVLFDRHYVDMAVHPQRFEMSLPRWLILLLYKLIPKADYTFFLYCTSEEILQRKQEFTKGEIQQMTDDYMKVGKQIKNFIPIHTNTSIAEEMDEMLSHISKR